MKNIKGLLQNSLHVFLSGGLREANLEPQAMAPLLSIHYANMRKRLDSQHMGVLPGASLHLYLSVKWGAFSKTRCIEELHSGLMTNSQNIS